MALETGMFGELMALRREDIGTLSLRLVSHDQRKLLAVISGVVSSSAAVPFAQAFVRARPCDIERHPPVYSARSIIRWTQSAKAR